MSVTSTCYDLFEQTSSFARLNLSKCESSGLELSTSNIRAGFTANKDSSVIFNSTGYLVKLTKLLLKGEITNWKKFSIATILI